jgi:hypothetical protein
MIQSSDCDRQEPFSVVLRARKTSNTSNSEFSSAFCQLLALTRVFSLCVRAVTTTTAATASAVSPERVSLNARLSKRRVAESLRGPDAMQLSEELLSDCVYLFAVGHAGAVQSVADAVRLRDSASFTAVAHKAFALRRVS